MPRPPPSPLFPYTTLFRSQRRGIDAIGRDDVVRERRALGGIGTRRRVVDGHAAGAEVAGAQIGGRQAEGANRDRKSTRLNSSHVEISYAVFCLKKKKKKAY